MASPDNSLSFGIGGNKTAPYRNGKLAGTDSFAFAQLDEETKFRILRFNTDPGRALLTLAKKLAALSEQDKNVEHEYAPKVFSFSPDKVQPYIVADDKGTYLLEGRGLRVVLDENAETATVSALRNGKVEVEVYHPLRALSFSDDPVYFSPEYNGVYD